MSTNIHIQSNDQLLVTRDGNIDWEYSEQQYRTERQEALKAAGRELVARTLSFSLKTAHRAGTAVLQGLETYTTSLN